MYKKHHQNTKTQQTHLQTTLITIKTQRHSCAQVSTCPRRASRSDTRMPRDDVVDFPEIDKVSRDRSDVFLTQIARHLKQENICEKPYSKSLFVAPLARRSGLGPVLPITCNWHLMWRPAPCFCTARENTSERFRFSLDSESENQKRFS